ncbi:MAG: ABC transporter permease [Planctomycetes bacterium]|nr:ABC transporter permease [Planctomycetota bacterium]
MLAHLAEEFGLGLRNLRRYKLRSFLTTLGIVFGISSVIAMMAVGAGARAEILRQMRHLGVRNVICNSVRPPRTQKPTGQEEEWLGQFGLTFDDLDRIRETVPTVERALPVHTVKKGIWRGSKRIDAKIFGVLPEHFETLNLRPEVGRILSPLDVEKAERVCVVRRRLLNDLGIVEDPLRLDLRLGTVYFRVVGVLADEEYDSPTQKALSIDTRSSEVYVPFRTVLKTYGLMSTSSQAGSYEQTRIELDQILVRVRSEDDVADTARMLETVLAKFHEKRDFEILVPLEMLRQRRETQRVFSVVMILTAGISLLVGGIGIVNIMLATVAERTREIGIRRALGAKRRHIVEQFLMETLAIATLGGVLGCLVSFGGVAGIESATQWRTIVTPASVVLALGISCAVGILFGLYPAVRAARLHPIEALRHE